MYIYILVGCWPTPLKNDGVKVSCDDDIPNIRKVIKFMFQTTNQWWFTMVTYNIRKNRYLGEYPSVMKHALLEITIYRCVFLIKTSICKGVPIRMLDYRRVSNLDIMGKNYNLLTWVETGHDSLQSYQASFQWRHDVRSLQFIQI